MKIVIDISQAVYETGVSVYTRELTRALLKTAPNHEYVLYAGVLRRRKQLDQYVKTLEGDFKLVVLPLSPRLSDAIWNYTKIIPLEAVTGSADIVHVSDWTEPYTRSPKVTTIHDLAPLLYPNVTHPRIKRVFTRKLQLIKNNTDLIIVPSFSIEKDLISDGFSPGRIHVIPEAPNPELIQSPKINIHRRFNIQEKYILMVGTAGRKNLHRGIDAFLSLKLKNTQLVIVGEKQNIEKNEPSICYTGFVSTTELSNLYRSAEVFLYPSLYEGFGLPILEAYALSCPTVTSNVGSMQEVGNAAVLINPYDTNDIANGVLKALSRKKELITAGHKFVKKFSWETTARETLAVYEKAYEKF